MTATTHAHEDWQMSKDADGQPYCTVCGEHPDPVQQALSAYRAAVDEVRRAEHEKQKAARALYEARLAAGQKASPNETDSGEPLPSHAFRHSIAYVGEPTVDGRTIQPGAVNWQFGERIPVSLAPDGGVATPVGYAITSHIDDEGGVQATIYVDEKTAALITPQTAVSIGVGLDSLEADLSGDNSAMVVKGGRLRQVLLQEGDKAPWPGCVVKHP